MTATRYSSWRSVIETVYGRRKNKCCSYGRRADDRWRQPRPETRPRCSTASSTSPPDSRSASSRSGCSSRSLSSVSAAARLQGHDRRHRGVPAQGLRVRAGHRLRPGPLRRPEGHPHRDHAGQARRRQGAHRRRSCRGRRARRDDAAPPFDATARSSGQPDAAQRAGRVVAAQAGPVAPDRQFQLVALQWKANATDPIAQEHFREIRDRAAAQARAHDLPSASPAASRRSRRVEGNEGSAGTAQRCCSPPSSC